MENQEQIALRMQQIEEAKAKLPTAFDAAAKAKENHYIKEERDKLTMLGMEVRLYNYFADIINEAVNDGLAFLTLKKDVSNSMFHLPVSQAVTSATVRTLEWTLYRNEDLYSKLVEWLRNNGYSITEKEDYILISWY